LELQHKLRETGGERLTLHRDVWVPLYAMSDIIFSLSTEGELHTFGLGAEEYAVNRAINLKTDYPGLFQNLTIEEIAMDFYKRL
jgi:hypothetical protein